MSFASIEILTNTFYHNNTFYRVTSFRGGDLEIYKDDNGLDIWQGYIHEVSIDLGEAAYDAYNSLVLEAIL